MAGARSAPQVGTFVVANQTAPQASTGYLLRRWVPSTKSGYQRRSANVYEGGGRSSGVEGALAVKIAPLLMNGRGPRNSRPRRLASTHRPMPTPSKT